MRVPTAFVLPAALALAATLPAPPAQAVGCAGSFTLQSSCTFTAVAGTQILIQGTAFSGIDIKGFRFDSQVAVELKLPGGVVVQSCDGFGNTSSQCSATAVATFTTTYVCRAGGHFTGTFSCGTYGA